MGIKPKHSHKGEWKLHPPAWERMDKELAAHYVSERFPVVSDTLTVGEAHEYLNTHSSDLDAIDYIYMVNARKKLTGVVSIRSIFTHPSRTPLRNITKKEIITVSPEAHREKVARIALQNNLRAIPIVKNQRLEGVILTHKLLSIINQTLHERLLTISGIHHDHLAYDDTTKIPVLESTLHRIPWLVIGLIGIFIAAGVINQFESVLNEHLIVAFFIPAILYMSNALGSQNQILLIRDLGWMGKDFKTGPYLIKTMSIALVLSAIIGALVYGITALIWGDPTISFVIALAMSATLLVSAASSLLTTLAFRALHQDPATGSGPFATIISDVTSILIYFLIVSVML